MSNIYNAILKRRSIRRFTDDEVPDALILKMINAARVAPSAANIQPLHYVIVKSPKLRDEVFENTMWAGYVKPEGTPPFDKRPRLFVAVLCDSRIKKEKYEQDSGLAIENMILTAWEENVGSCIIAACNKAEIRRILNIPDHFILDCVVGFGYPAHKCDCFDDPSGNIKYTMDKNENFHVPKRPIEDVMTILS
jgi:Nitroreductase